MTDRGFEVRQLSWGALALALLQSAQAQSPPSANLLDRSNYTIFSGDVNGDGYIDILAKAKRKITMIALDDLAIPVPIRTPVATFTIMSSQNGSYSLSTTVSQSTLASSAWRASTHDLRFGDILGNGAGGAIIEARNPGDPSFSVTANSSGQPLLLQTLNSTTLGYDLSAAGTTTELGDRNGDGRTDLTVRLNGLVAAVFYANSSGIFVADQEATIRASWQGFKAHVDAGNLNSALNYIAVDSIPTYTNLMQRLGGNLSSASATWSDIKAIYLAPDYASFALFDNYNNVRTLHYLTFVRENGRWVLESL